MDYTHLTAYSEQSLELFGESNGKIESLPIDAVYSDPASEAKLNAAIDPCEYFCNRYILVAILKFKIRCRRCQPASLRRLLRTIRIWRKGLRTWKDWCK